MLLTLVVSFPRRLLLPLALVICVLARMNAEAVAEIPLAKADDSRRLSVVVNNRWVPALACLSNARIGFVYVHVGSLQGCGATRSLHSVE